MEVNATGSALYLNGDFNINGILHPRIKLRKLITTTIINLIKIGCFS